jgi:hypothetical protein
MGEALGLVAQHRAGFTSDFPTSAAAPRGDCSKNDDAVGDCLKHDLVVDGAQRMAVLLDQTLTVEALKISSIECPSDLSKSASDIW